MHGADTRHIHSMGAHMNHNTVWKLSKNCIYVEIFFNSTITFLYHHIRLQPQIN